MLARIDNSHDDNSRGKLGQQRHGRVNKIANNRGDAAAN